MLFTRPSGLWKSEEQVAGYREDALFGDKQGQEQENIEKTPACLKMLPDAFWKEVGECA